MAQPHESSGCLTVCRRPHSDHHHHLPRASDPHRGLPAYCMEQKQASDGAKRRHMPTGIHTRRGRGDQEDSAQSRSVRAGSDARPTQPAPHLRATRSRKETLCHRPDAATVETGSETDARQKVGRATQSQTKRRVAIASRSSTTQGRAKEPEELQEENVRANQREHGGGDSRTLGRRQNARSTSTLPQPRSNGDWSQAQGPPISAVSAAYLR